MALELAEERELKHMILSFRVSELHMLLGFAGRNKNGKKSELQARAIELLQLGSYPLLLKIRNLYKSIQPVCSSESVKGESSLPEGNGDVNSEKTVKSHGTYYPDSYDELNQDQSVNMYGSDVYQHPGTVKYNSPIHPSQYPVHPDVKLKRLPFYEVVAELLKPSSLVPKVSSRVQENSFVFHLTPQQATAIGLSRDLRSGTKVDYTVQGQLRFCLLETTSEQEDCYPPGALVKINNKICQLPNPIPTSKPGVEPKRPPRPVNITHLMKISPTVGNTVQVQWTSDYARRFVVAVYLVHKKSSEDLLNRLKAKGVRGADYTRGMIKDKLNEDADSEIATTSLRVSLICPLGKMRMITPCRASTCQHLQCFDASLYLQMNERKPTWMCPVCDKPALYDKLVIDGYFQEVLSSDKLTLENEIQLHSDGSWSSLIVKKEPIGINEGSESNNSLKIEAKVETVQVDVDDINTTPEPKKEDLESSPKKEANAAKRKVDEIDLTVSDSDDEPLIIHKRRGESYFDDFVKYSGNASTDLPESVISSERNSPSIIVLDSDSSSSSSSSSISVPAQSPHCTRSHSANALLYTDNSLSTSVDSNLLSCPSSSNISMSLSHLLDI